MAIVLFGLVNVYSASMAIGERYAVSAHYFVLQQASGVIVGLAGMMIAAFVPYRTWERLAWPILGLTVILLGLLVLPWTEGLAPVVNGSRRWLQVGPGQFQPSEAAKLGLLVWTAALAVRKQDHLDDFRQGLAPLLIVWALIAGLVMAEPDFSTAAFLLALAVTVAFAAGARLRHLFGLLVLALPYAWHRISTSGYRGGRLEAFLDAGAGGGGLGYQSLQARIALGAGGITGRGFGAGQQKFGFLPEPHNDFILAVIGEEWGLVGVLIVALAFLAFGATGYRISRQAPTLFGYLLGIGVTSMIIFQALLHMGVNVGLLPTTGIPLPFLSYGRSSMVISLTGVGILLNLSRPSANGGA